jgi:nitrogen fixation NifU-like protein
MAAATLYKEVLLDHFHHPRNKGDLADAQVTRRGSNPRCGDEIEVGIDLEAGRLTRVRFRGRGCSVCIASASMMTEAVTGRDPAEARALAETMQGLFAPGDEALREPPPSLEALSVVCAYPARRRCVLLSWEALADAIDAL